MVQVHQFGTGTRYGLKTLHKCGKKVETIIQKIFGSDPYVGSSYSGKTGRGGFLSERGGFLQNFQKGEIYLIGENFFGKKFLLGKVFVTQPIFRHFSSTKSFSQI